MKIKTVAHFNAPLPKVFEAFVDLENAAERISGIKSLELLTDGPMRVGTRWRETRVFMKREATEEMEVTEFEPQKHYAVGAESCGCIYETHFRFRSNGTGTDVEMEFGGKPTNFIAKLMAPLGMLMAGTVKKAIEQDFEDLRQHIESNSQN